MCFNAGMSYGFAVIGFSSAVYLRYKKATWLAYTPIAYFSLMELLQGVGYLLINQCSFFTNQLLAYVLYFHVCFQPLFFNWWVACFLPENNRQAFLSWTNKLCLLGGVLMLYRLLPHVGMHPPYLSSFLLPCNASIEAFCGISACVFSGTHHIAMQVPLRPADYLYITPGINLHFFLFFMPAIVMGFIRLSLVFFIIGPLFAYLLTKNIHEQPLIWCFFFIPQLLITNWLLNKGYLTKKSHQ